MDTEGWVASYGQLPELGLSVRAADRLVRSGAAFRPLPRVVATAPPTPMTYARAGLARAGDDAALWGPSAALVYLGESLRLPVQVLHRGSSRLADTASVRFHRAVGEPDRLLHRGWPVVAPAVAAAQVAQSDEPERERRSLVTGLLRIGAASAEQIARAAGTTPYRERGQVTRLVEEILANAWSVAEAEFWRAQVEAHMPVPRLNAPFTTSRGRRYVDGLLEPLGAGYEIHGRAAHESAWDDDLARAADLIVDCGLVLLPLPAALILTDVRAALDRLARFWAWRAGELGVSVPIHVPPPRWRPAR